jgi:[ribosomal protein S5]-alanine N-acetyltransferase
VYNIFLQGESIYLRPLEQGDLTMEYVAWLNDTEVCEFNSHAVFPYTKEKMESYYQHLQQTSSSNIVLAIIDKSNHNHIGNISLQSINWINRNAEYAILLGEKSYWGKGVASEASILICEYGFSRLNLHRIYCGTSSKNIGMQKLAAKMNMKQEGIRKEAIFKNGEYLDIVEYGVLKNDFLK